MESTHNPAQNAAHRSPVQSAALFAIRGVYQRLSAVTPKVCRFQPSCSEYMAQAIEKYGVLVGFWMGLKRLLRCHPFHEGGFDPVE
ncbi:MAG: membrane protein insertion efficiency factor YidD [Armatimonadetes bacterium]|nr:membrane protein insertion efficiency factor YidD [Armatimonadota bacterium]